MSRRNMIKRAKIRRGRILAWRLSILTRLERLVAHYGEAP